MESNSEKNTSQTLLSCGNGGGLSCFINSKRDRSKMRRVKSCFGQGYAENLARAPLIYLCNSLKMFTICENVYGH